MTPPLISGYGARHGKHVGFYAQITYEQIQALVDHPQSKAKERAQWVIPSTLMTRVHEEQRQNGQYWMLWADLDKNPPGPDEVESFIKSFASDYEIYATRSSTPEVPKCRILIPLAKPISGTDWVICQKLFNDQLEAAGITPDRSTQKTGQPCYLPNAGAHYFSRSRREGCALSVMWEWEELIAAEREAIANALAKEQAEREAREVARASKEINRSETLIYNFNEKYAVEDILLEGGYDQEGNRFRHPGSLSGSFSAYVRDGRVITFSPNDPLYTEPMKAHDAFSVFTVLFAEGDLTKALVLAGNEWVKIDGKPWNEVKRLERAIKEFEVSSFDNLTGQIQNATDREELMAKIPAAITAAGDLNEVMRKELRKLLAKKTGISVAALEADAKAFNRVQANQDKDHLPAAREVIKTFGEENLICVNQVFWQWQDDRIWREIDDRVVKQRIHQVSASRTLTANVVNSILDLVKTELSRPNHRFNEVDPNSISIANGVLSYEKRRWTLRPHRREDYKNTLIPVAYDPAAKALRFERFLEEVFAGVSDKDELILTTKQALGYTLIPSCRFEKFFMLIGAGANGKSVLLRVVEGLVGREQVCAVQPTHFENPHKLAHLNGKLANIITEMPEGGKIADAALKALISGELTTADKKFQEPFDFYPIATHWYGTNHLPHTRDFSEAFFRRALVIQFPNKFYGDQRDPNLAEKLLKELPGILNLALDGLARLIEAGEFLVPESSRCATEAWRLDVDQVAQFAMEKLAIKQGAFISTQSLFSDYERWARGGGIRLSVNKRTFSDRLERLGYTRSRGAKGSRGFRDIDWNEQTNSWGYPDGSETPLDPETEALLY